MQHQATVLLIMGSTRAGRVCPLVAAWVAAQAASQPQLACEIVDLADWPLPMDDEPAMPAIGPYAQPHTRAWSAKVTAADAVVLVTPQYNWGYPAVLKNAIDHLYREWRDKPAMIVSYGGHGGGKSAAQLMQVAAAVKLRLVPTMPALLLPGDVIRAGVALDPVRDFASHADETQRAFAELAVLIDAA